MPCSWLHLHNQGRHFISMGDVSIFARCASHDVAANAGQGRSELHRAETGGREHGQRRRIQSRHTGERSCRFGKAVACQQASKQAACLCLNLGQTLLSLHHLYRHG